MTVTNFEIHPSRLVSHGFKRKNVKFDHGNDPGIDVGPLTDRPNKSNHIIGCISKSNSYTEKLICLEFRKSLHRFINSLNVRL